MDLMTIAKRIYDDANDTINNIVDLAQYYPVVSKGLLDDGDRMVNADLDRLEAMTQSFQNGLTIQTDVTAVNLVVEKSVTTGKYLFYKDLNTRFENMVKDYDNYCWFVEKVIKADCGTEAMFYDRFTTTYEIDEFDAEDAVAIWEMDDIWWEQSLVDGSDNNYVLSQLVAHYSVTGFNPVLLASVNISDGLVTKFGNLTDLLNQPVDIENVFDNLNTAVQVQNILKVISEQVLMGHYKKEDLIGILTTCKNSYTNKGAEVLEYFLNTLQGAGTLPFITALFNVYTSMSKTKVNEQSGEIQFYDATYATEFAFSTVLKGVLPVISSVVTAITSAILPIAGGIVYAISSLANTVIGAIGNLEEVSINDQATNRCFGYPINQNTIGTTETGVAFMTYAKNFKLVTATTPIFCYSIWTNTDGSKAFIESFPIVNHSRADLEYVLFDVLGYKRDMENVNYEFMPVSANTIKLAWTELSKRQNFSAYENMSAEDQLWCLLAVLALIQLLSGDDGSALTQHWEYYDDDHTGRSWNYILTHNTINNWEKMYDWYMGERTNLAGAILYDKLVSGKDWWRTSDFNYLTSENIYDSPLSIMTSCFWDRNLMYAKPPKFTKGSILLTCLAVAAAAAAIAVSIMLVKRKIETVQRRKYAEINARQGALQDSLKQTDPALRPSKAQINAELNSIRKDTKRYNRLAKLTGASTLSYFSGWENGDVDTTSAEGINNYLENFAATDEDSLSIIKLIRG